jgi:membrane protease YdiL (CAAX protease family)
VPDCLLHPGTPAASSCDYCGQPHCEDCLQPLLGRRYCPACAEGVRAVAEGRAVRVEAPPPGSVAPPPRAEFVLPEGPRPRLPGWASGLVYLLGFLLFVQILAAAVLMLPLELAQLATGKFPATGIGEAALTDASALGLPRWSALFGLFTWGMLGVTVVYTRLFVRWVERRHLADLGLTWAPARPWHPVAGLALAGVLFLSMVGCGARYGWYEVRLDARSAAEGWSIALGGLALLLPYAAVEEIAMRGYLLNVFARSWGRGAGMLGSTVIFAALHAANPGFNEHPLALLGLLLAGLYLASAYLITGDLWLAIFLHAGWNLMEGPIFGLPVSGIEVPAAVLRTSAVGPSLWTGGSFGPEAGLLLCLMMAIHLAVLWVLRPVLRPTPATL